ncbi:chondroadherin-like protein [Parasteatoda tepidariorum]|uniref:chondroadherin-like protein n=1 Tax=Parasteatoda tepidariorum TaxID=114398 RepID=UPI001C7266BC|nr:keratocan [Parasteatoda tepidariorum]
MLLSILIFEIAAVAFALDCPPRETVYPCSCAEEQGHAVVNCEGFNSMDELEPVVKNTVGYKVTFAIFRSHLGDIRSDFFKGHSSVKLRFENCIVRSFGDIPFSGLENSLETLYLYTAIEKSHTEMDKFRLSRMKKLRYITIANNDIEEVGNHWFEGGPASLEQIVLSSNKIERIGEKAFASLVNLQLLYLNDNKIKSVARSMLPNPAKMLWSLNAKSNEIEELPTDAFEGYPNLNTVNLSQNRLKSIPENVWGKIWSQLQAVYMDDNDVVCDENLKWIYKQQLPKIFVGKCGPGNALHDKDFNSLKLEDFQ